MELSKGARRIYTSRRTIDLMYTDVRAYSTRRTRRWNRVSSRYSEFEWVVVVALCGAVSGTLQPLPGVPFKLAYADLGMTCFELVDM